MKRLAVIGGGAWGTALAIVARRAGAEPMLWARDPAVVAAINRRHENPLYLPGVALDPAIAATTDLAAALAGAEAALLVVPAQFLRGVLAELAPHLPAGLPLLLCAKGIETGSLKTMSELAGEIVPGPPVAVLSGPSFAAEVARDLPTAVTIASRDADLAGAFVAALGSAALPALSVGRPDRRRDRRRGQERAGDRLRHRRRARPRRQCARRADHPRPRRDGPARASPRAPSRRRSAACPGSATWC